MLDKNFFVVYTDTNQKKISALESVFEYIHNKKLDNKADIELLNSVDLSKKKIKTEWSYSEIRSVIDKLDLKNDEEFLKQLFESDVTHMYEYMRFFPNIFNNIDFDQDNNSLILYYLLKYKQLLYFGDDYVKCKQYILELNNYDPEKDEYYNFETLYELMLFAKIYNKVDYFYISKILNKCQEEENTDVKFAED